MVDGRKREAWNHTAQVLAMVYNTHRDPKSRMLRPADFHPMAPQREPARIKDLSVLRNIFVKPQTEPSPKTQPKQP